MNDDKKYQVQFTVPYPENPSRKLALATILFMVPKLIILIPHFIGLYFLSFVFIVLAIIAQFIVLFTGKYPESLHEYVHGILQWRLRVTAYLTGLTDEYPPFTLK